MLPGCWEDEPSYYQPHRRPRADLQGDVIVFDPECQESRSLREWHAMPRGNMGRWPPSVVGEDGHWQNPANYQMAHSEHGNLVYYPVRLGYCSTIQKVQGDEFPSFLFTWTPRTWIKARAREITTIISHARLFKDLKAEL